MPVDEEFIKGIILELEKLKKICEDRMKEIWSLSKRDLEHLIDTYNELKLGILLNLGQEGRRIVDDMPDVKPLKIDEVFASATGEKKLTDIITGCSYAIGVLEEISKKKIPIEVLVKIRRYNESLKLMKIDENLRKELSEAINAALNGLFLASALVLSRILKAYLEKSNISDKKFEEFIKCCFDVKCRPDVNKTIDALEAVLKIADKISKVFN